MKLFATAIAAAVALAGPVAAKTTVLSEVRTPTKAWQWALVENTNNFPWGETYGFNFAVDELGTGSFYWFFRVFDLDWNETGAWGRAAIWADDYQDVWECWSYNETGYARGSCGAPEGYHFDNITIFELDDPVYIYAGVYNMAYETSVPEPAAWALMISGFGLVGMAARRRQAAAISTGAL